MNNLAQPESVESIKAAFTEDKMNFTLAMMKEAAECRLARREAANAPARREVFAGRNDPCPCGSGKKFKKCCLRGMI